MTPHGVIWPDGRSEAIDTVIWCTGFRPALAHLWPLGYGDWTGLASATLTSVGHTARETVSEIEAYLDRPRNP
jgi:hypothetical protein